jgi:hypothetical protein
MLAVTKRDGGMGEEKQISHLSFVKGMELFVYFIAISALTTVSVVC